MFNKKDFIDQLVETLNQENETMINYSQEPLDVSFMVSAVDQHIEECEELVNELNIHNYCINGYYEDNTLGYTLGKVRILIEKPEEEKESDYLCDAYYDYHYEIEFVYDQRDWGYCTCTPETEGYSEEHECCGMGCDWCAPAFNVSKIVPCGYFKWDGFEKDYWEYEKQFKQSEENKNLEVEKLEKERKKQCIEQQMKELQKQLKELEQ